MSRISAAHLRAHLCSELSDEVQAIIRTNTYRNCYSLDGRPSAQNATGRPCVRTPLLRDRILMYHNHRAPGARVRRGKMESSPLDGERIGARSICGPALYIHDSDMALPSLHVMSDLRPFVPSPPMCCHDVFLITTASLSCNALAFLTWEGIVACVHDFMMSKSSYRVCCL